MLFPVVLLTFMNLTSIHPEYVLINIKHTLWMHNSNKFAIDKSFNKSLILCVK